MRYVVLVALLGALGYVLVARPTALLKVYHDLLSATMAVENPLGPRVPVYPKLDWQVTSKYLWIRKEYLAARRALNLPEFDRFDLGEPDPHPGMHKLFLRAAGTWIPKNAARFPRTVAALKAVGEDYTVNAMFSVLEPGKHIPPHEGAFKTLVRYHLDVDVPEPGASELSFPGVPRREWVQWREGEAVMIDDTYTHEVHHKGTKECAVLFLDVRRREFPAWIHRIDDALHWAIRNHPTTHAFRQTAIAIEEGKW